MLVLSRGPGEKVLIGPDIEVTVVAILGLGKVRLGITAPDNIAIDRPDAKDHTPKERGVVRDNGVTA